MEKHKWGITMQACSGIEQDPIPKITNAKRAGRVAQGVEYLPNKFKALSSTLQYCKKKKGAYA
jgi:hypothetical protein